MKIKKIVLMRPPNLDSIAALWLLKRFGEEKYPGVGSANSEYWRPDEVDNSKLYDAGTLALNVEGGLFYPGRPEQEQYVCSFRLVYHDLGLENVRSLNSIYECVVKYEEWRKPFEGTDPIDQTFHLTQLVYDFQNFYANDASVLQDWLFNTFDAHHHMEVEWLSLFEQMKTAHQLQTEEGHKIIKLESAHPFVTKAYRAKGYHACLHHNPLNKNVMLTWIPELQGVSPFQRTNLICHTAKKLRQEEAELRGMVYDEAELLNPGVYCGWFLNFDREFVCYDRRALPENEFTLIEHTRVLELIAESFESMTLRYG